MHSNTLVALACCGIANIGSGLPAVKFNVSQTYPHETECFTEGFMLTGGSQPEVFESCGMLGLSYIRRYRLADGQELQRGEVPVTIFGEGIAVIGNRMFVLTYQSHMMLEYNRATFRQVKSHDFPFGEGWGLTTDGCHLLATTGTSYLYRIFAGSHELQLISKTLVTYEGQPLPMLNEVEYVTPKVWVNQWRTNRLFRLDPFTGVCERLLDIQGLYSWEGESTPNGIAYSATFEIGQLIITGKNWGSVFALNLSSSDLCGYSSTPEIADNGPACDTAPLSACWPGRSSAASTTRFPARLNAARLAMTSQVESIKQARPKASMQPGGAFIAVATILSIFLAIAGAVIMPLLLRRQYTILRRGASLSEEDNIHQ